MDRSHISLFSGVGMTDLMAEAHGFETVAVAEQDDFCLKVLRVRFPAALRFKDVRDLGVAAFPRPEGELLMSGGFPCQDISLAGHGAGLDGERSGLWSEFARLIGEYEPDYVLIENVAALRGRGLDRVLRDLHDLGYNARWDCIPAAAVGAPHMRDRMFIAATRHDDEDANRALDHDLPRFADSKVVGTVTERGVEASYAGRRVAVEKLPRAGRMVEGDVFEDAPLATQRDVKKSLKAGEMLLPSPSKSEPGWRNLDVRDKDGNAPTHPNQRFYDKASGRVVQKGVAQIAAMFPDLKPASHRTLDDFPERMVPTPTAGDAKSTRNETSEAAWNAEGRHSGRTLTDYAMLYPTPKASDDKRKQGRGVGSIERGGGIELPMAATMAERGLFPVPEDMTRAEAVRETLYPTPSRRDGMGGPGRSPHRKGGPNLRTVVNEKDGDYKLNPLWVEWLMGLPANWTNPDVPNDQVGPFEGWEAERLPRIDPDAPHRRPRLQACGNGLVPQAAAVALRWMVPPFSEGAIQ